MHARGPTRRSSCDRQAVSVAVVNSTRSAREDCSNGKDTIRKQWTCSKIVIYGVVIKIPRVPSRLHRHRTTNQRNLRRFCQNEYFTKIDSATHIFWKSTTKQNKERLEFTPPSSLRLFWLWTPHPNLRRLVLGCIYADFAMKNSMENSRRIHKITAWTNIFAHFLDIYSKSTFFPRDVVELKFRSFI